MTFEEWWASLPSKMKRGDKARAKSRYHTIEKNGELIALQEALLTYIQEQKMESWRQWLQAPSFIGRWKEWATERTEALEDEKPELLQGMDLASPEHKHYCKGCGTGHDWQCSDPDCIYPGHALCTLAVDKKLAVSR